MFGFDDFKKYTAYVPKVMEFFYTEKGKASLSILYQYVTSEANLQDELQKARYSLIRNGKNVTLRIKTKRIGSLEAKLFEDKKNDLIPKSIIYKDSHGLLYDILNEPKKKK